MPTGAIFAYKCHRRRLELRIRHRPVLTEVGSTSPVHYSGGAEDKPVMAFPVGERGRTKGVGKVEEGREVIWEEEVEGVWFDCCGSSSPDSIGGDRGTGRTGQELDGGDERWRLRGGGVEVSYVLMFIFIMLDASKIVHVLFFVTATLVIKILINLLLQNYSSIITAHPETIDGRPATLVMESFVVDVPDGNTKEETCYFVEALIKCNLNSLAQLSERLAAADEDYAEPI
ncbi:hypothetical protein GW17_00040643 [Ensete ventricosum]|nr:hypothetical protein GW17_00040643 [Ensete ventricosum]